MTQAENLTNLLQEKVSDFNEYDSRLKQVINPVLEKHSLNKQEELEVCQIGQFLVNINPQIKIVDKPKPPSPDFILINNGKLIGLEHTRLINPKNAEGYFSVNSLFNDAAKEFQRRYPEKKIFASYRIIGDNLVFTKNERKHLIDIICNATNIFHSANNPAALPAFISEIRIMPHDRVSFSFLEDDFRGDKLTKDVLIEAIRGKENKLENHYKSTEMQEFWLVLMIGSLNSTSYELDDEIDYTTESVFDKVFLVEDFNRTIIRIKE
jgi:hypothetical protein